MADRVFIVVPGVGVLALADDAYRAALAEGAQLNGAPASSDAASDEPLMEAEQLAQLLKIPVTWIDQKAREGVIPSLEFGRWRRFRRSEVEAAVRANREQRA